MFPTLDRCAVARQDRGSIGWICLRAMSGPIYSRSPPSAKRSHGSHREGVAKFLTTRQIERIGYEPRPSSTVVVYLSSIRVISEISHTKLLSRKISEFCLLRVDPVLPQQESTRIRDFLIGLISRSETPPRKLRKYDWEEIALLCDLDKDALRIARAAIEPALDAIVRNTKSSPKHPPVAARHGSVSETQPRRGRPPRKPVEKTIPEGRNGTSNGPERPPGASRQKPGAAPRAIEEFPSPLFSE